MSVKRALAPSQNAPTIAVGIGAVLEALLLDGLDAVTLSDRLELGLLSLGTALIALIVGFAAQRFTTPKAASPSGRGTTVTFDPRYSSSYFYVDGERVNPGESITLKGGAWNTLEFGPAPEADDDVG